MTTDKLREVFQFYHKALYPYAPMEFQFEPVDYDMKEPLRSQFLNHVRWMCKEAINVLIPENQIDKAMRWLGYVQGVLNVLGIYSCNELREHSRSEDK